ncbi:MAG: SH3 domain-containing protein [Syntrophomonas sp.]
MPKTGLKLVITLLLCLNLVGASMPAGAAPVNQMPDVSREMLEPEFWIDKLAEPDRIIMPFEDIDAFNQAIIKALPGTVCDLKTCSTFMSGDELRKQIDVSFPEDPMYIGPDQVTLNYLGRLRANMNLAGIKDRNEVKYAFTVRRSSLRVYPTSDVVSDEKNDQEFDLFQNTAVHPFEPLLIYHQSADRNWYFARMYNCFGWLPAEDVAISPDRKTWIEYQEPGGLVVVTGNRLHLCENPNSPEISNLGLPMGTVIPLTDSTIPAMIDRQDPTGNYVVKLAVRTSSGQLDFKLGLLPYSLDIQEGYMPYTRANAIRQAFKLQGDRYGWGGMLDSHDCSSLILDVYRCFGFRLPRNSEQQAASAGKTVSFQGIAAGRRADLFKDLLPGASLHFPGHVMLYLGEEGGHYYVISALGSRAIKGSNGTMETLRVHGVVVNDLELTRKSGKTWMESLTVAKQYQ